MKYNSIMKNWDNSLMIKVIKVENLISKLATDKYSKWSVDYWCNVRKELRKKMLEGIKC